MLTQVRCPGCSLLIKFDEDKMDGDTAIERHTMRGCGQPDEKVLERATARRRQEEERERHRSAARERRG